MKWDPLDFLELQNIVTLNDSTNQPIRNIRSTLSINILLDLLNGSDCLTLVNILADVLKYEILLIMPPNSILMLLPQIGWVLLEILEEGLD